MCKGLPAVKIFATDLDEASLSIGRNAAYPSTAADAIPPDLRERFTLNKGHQIEIRKELRSCVIFARHNICTDPPFPEIRLISCRNLLIYFTPPLQEKMISLLSFSLQPGGLLLLGGSESFSRYRLATLPGQRKPSYQRLASVAIREREVLPTQHLQLQDALTDISELVALRRVAEGSLQEFERLTDALDPVVWKRDLLSGKCLYISARIQDLTGWQAQEVAALPDLLDSTIVPEDRPAVRAARDAGQAGWTVTYGFTRRDGQRRTMLEVAIPLRDASSDHAVVGTLSDITDRHQQASRLALLRESLQALLARDPDPTALLDGDLRVVLINPAFTRLLPALAPEDGEVPPLTVLERLVPLASGRAKADGAMAEVLRAVALQAGANASTPVRLPVAWAEGQAPAAGAPEAFTLELVPVPADLEAPGLLLRLRGLAADQRQSSNTPPFVD